MKAEIVLDSINPQTGIRLTTMQLEYPQFIHQQFLTHRMFSRNSSSFRAMSTKRVLKNELVFPVWTKEKKGMQGERFNLLESEKDAAIYSAANEILSEMFETVSDYVDELNQLGIHHQNANAYLRPFLNINTLVTATEYQNFFDLRLSEHSQPEIFHLALLMKEAMRESVPVRNFLHLPFTDDDFLIEKCTQDDFLVSAARCARISYLSKGGNYKSDLALGRKLWSNKHLSPFEHQAIAREDRMYANFYTWRSYRNSKGY